MCRRRDDRLDPGGRDLIGSAEGVTHVREYHEMALFTREEMTGALEQAGFLVSYDPEGLTGRGLYTGRIRQG